MKYRINEDFAFKLKGQKFSRMRPEYKFDEKTGKLVVVGEIDIVEEIQSSAECALDKILDKYGYNDLLSAMSSNNIIDSDEIADCTEKVDLVSLGEYKTNIQDWRETLRLGSDVSDNQILSYMSEKSNLLKERIAQVKDKFSQNKDKISQGGTIDEEKKIVNEEQ